MEFAKRFVARFSVVIIAVLSCFDRVVFKGYLPFGDDGHLSAYVDGVLRMRRKDFLPWLERHSQALVDHAKQLANDWGRPCEYHQGRFNKEFFIQNMIHDDRLDEGLVAVLCVQETCRTVKLIRGKMRPQLIFARRPQRVLYFYWLDRDFGLIHVRLQTWFPYTIQGEVLTDLKKKRHPGARVKHRVKENWLKMYDKFGLILRVETVINQPREFRVRRRRTRKGHRQMMWCPMNKGVANLPSCQQVARGANQAYLEALSVVADPAPSYQQVSRLVESKVCKGRRYAGFNPARSDDVQLFRAVMSGEHLLRGFRNAEIRQLLWGNETDVRCRQRQSNRVTRLLKRLHARALIAKIPHTRRWRVTMRGQQMLGAILQLHYHGLSTAA